LINRPPESLPLMLADFPRVSLGHFPTPLEPMPRLSRALGADLYIKRDDCSGLAFGGNKVRQLEYYMGDAIAKGADTVIITGAVQSNYVRATAAAAARLGLACEVQLEDRVPRMNGAYHASGNMLLNRLLGARCHYYPKGDDEAGADQALDEIAERVRARGGRPYVIPLGAGHPPIGGLGYIPAAREILDQARAMDVEFTAIIVGSGSAMTHAGLLVGLSLAESTVPVYGICVRRPAPAQAQRVSGMIDGIAALVGIDNPPGPRDVRVSDATLGAYGQLNAATVEAINLAARTEGLILDPVYTGKALAGAIDHIRRGVFTPGDKLLFIHTGGTPALFAYGDALIADNDKTASPGQDEPVGAQNRGKRRAKSPSILRPAR